jgi:hypothetical protein
MNQFVDTKTLAGIQYMGLAGITLPCLNAVFRLIHFGDAIDEAILLTGEDNSDFSGRHCFVVLTSTRRQK